MLPLAPGGSPRLNAIVGEAWRNLAAGATRGLWFGLAFLVFCGSLALVEARLVVGFVQDALVFRDSGAAIWVVTLPQGVDGQQCDALAGLPGIRAAGAVRPGAGLVPAALPSSRVSSWDVTPGFLDLLDTGANPGRASGVWLSSDLADRLGLAASGWLPLTGGTGALVAGVYHYPKDGRLPTLAYSAVAPVAPSRPFDQCWVFAWPEPDAATPVLTLPLLPVATSPGAQPPGPTTVQLNSTHGLAFDGPRVFDRLPLVALELAGLGVGSILGFLSVRMRRLDLASSLHAGLTKTALGLQALVETFLWAGTAALPALVACLAVAMAGNTADWWPAFAPAVRTLGLGWLAALLGAVGALGLTRETHLFRYFRQR